MIYREEIVQTGMKEKQLSKQLGMKEFSNDLRNNVTTSALATNEKRHCVLIIYQGNFPHPCEL